MEYMKKSLGEPEKTITLVGFGQNFRFVLLILFAKMNFNE